MNVKGVHKWRNAHNGAWPSAGSEDEHERFLANFLHHQRKKLCKQQLSEERRKQLDNIPGFSSAQMDQRWNDTYLQVCEWVEERRTAQQFIHRLLPSRYSSDPQEKNMGVWIMNQRAAAKQSNDRKLTAERMALLEGMSGWTWEHESDTWKQFSDTCPNCKRTIEFDRADTKNLNHEHDDGKGGTCRFQGVVVAGRIQANLRRNPWQCTGSCGRALTKNDFSAKMQNRKDKVCKDCPNAKKTTS